MSTENKLTAVEWLQKEIIKFHNWKLNPIYDEDCFDEIELEKSIIKAKELEKKQIIDFAKEACNYNTLKNNDFEDIYNETFKN